MSSKSCTEVRVPLTVNLSGVSKFAALRTALLAFGFCVAAAIIAHGQALAPIVTFNGTNGSEPRAGMIQGSDGNFYGTTSLGGANNGGTVFRMTPAGTLTTLYNFCSQANCTDGSSPRAIIQANDGNFYGVTASGGNRTNCFPGIVPAGCGTVFEVTASGTFSTIYAFCAQSGCPDGEFPASLIQATDGNLYGVTGGFDCSNPPSNANCGSVFKMTLGGSLSNFHIFNGHDGQEPVGLIQASDGNFYGTTMFGGTPWTPSLDPAGTVFEITSGGSFMTLYSFCQQRRCFDGWAPNAGVMQAADGNFYGTTPAGGSHGRGTIFEITPAGTYTVLYSFFVPNGAPSMGLIQATDGNFYGTTGAYGTSSGIVFEFTPAGTWTSLDSFTQSNGAYPNSLIQGADGKFYGTTLYTQPTNSVGGTVFNFGYPTATPSKSALTFVTPQALNTTSPAQTVTMTSSGTRLLTFSSVAVSGNFAISSDTCTGATLAAGKICRVSVTFTPATLGPQSGTLTFTDNALNNPQTVTLSGTGVEPVTITPSTFNFPKTKVGNTSASHNFVVKNYLSTTLTGISYSTTGDFGVSTSTCGSTLGAKATCTISVTFTPTQTGTRMGQLSVSDNATNTPQTASLSGTGD